MVLQILSAPSSEEFLFQTFYERKTFCGKVIQEIISGAPRAEAEPILKRI